MGGDEHVEAGEELRADHVLPVRQHTGDDVGEVAGRTSGGSNRYRRLLSGCSGLVSSTGGGCTVGDSLTDRRR